MFTACPELSTPGEHGGDCDPILPGTGKRKSPAPRAGLLINRLNGQRKNMLSPAFLTASVRPQSVKHQTGRSSGSASSPAPPSQHDVSGSGSGLHITAAAPHGIHTRFPILPRRCRGHLDDYSVTKSIAPQRPVVNIQCLTGTAALRDPADSYGPFGGPDGPAPPGRSFRRIGPDKTRTAGKSAPLCCPDPGARAPGSFPAGGRGCCGG